MYLSQLARRTMLTFSAYDEQHTNRLGAALAEVLPAGSVVALIGTLGAGKTRLVEATAAALGVPREAVTSPTFVLVNEYRQGRLPVYHVDTYRLKDDDEFLDLGPDEYFDSDGITLVEWADRVAHLLPADRIEITLEIVGQQTRLVTITGRSPQTRRVVARIGEVLAG